MICPKPINSRPATSLINYLNSPRRQISGILVKFGLLGLSRVSPVCPAAGAALPPAPLAPISLGPPLNSTSKLPPDNTFVEVIDVGVSSSKDTWRRSYERGKTGDEKNEGQPGKDLKEREKEG